MNKAQIVGLSEALEDKGPQEILKWALDNFHPRVALASSFGAEDVALIDMMCRIIPRPRVFTLDTGRLHQETYNVMDRIRSRYNIAIEVYFPEASAVEKMVRENGPNLFYKSPDLRMLCCKIRKAEPLKRALSGLDAWITGLRREQTPTRSDVKKIELDKEHGGIIKANPLADWTHDQVWAYIRKHNVPYNELHNQGYPSVGCAPCTRAVKPGEDPRAGRWWWEQEVHKECGLHFKPKETIKQSGG